MEKVMPSTKSLTITHILNAPRSLVFKAWTEPAHLSRWWGPAGFTNLVCQLNLRAGGSLLIQIKGPDGKVYPMDGIYREIIEPEKLVFVGAAYDDRGTRLFEVLHTITFSEEGKKTKLTMQAEIIKATAEARPYLEGMENGWTQSINRLDAHVREIAENRTKEVIGSPEPALFITRMLRAPVDLVWKVWTEPEHIKNWWGPNGFTNTIYKMDLRAGGIWEYVMHGPDGTDFQNQNVFLEIIEKEKIMFAHQSFPKFTTTITFEAFGEKTWLDWRMLFESAEDFKKVLEQFKAAEGLEQNLAKLEVYLTGM